MSDLSINRKPLCGKNPNLLYLEFLSKFHILEIALALSLTDIWNSSLCYAMCHDQLVALKNDIQCLFLIIIVHLVVVAAVATYE